MFASDGDAQARKLARMKCKTCFKAGQQAKADVQAEADRATLAEIGLPSLMGSEKQRAWAAAIRLERLAALHRKAPLLVHSFAAIADAKWWIDHRGLDLSTLRTSDLAV